jgi:hypothetical protein
LDIDGAPRDDYDMDDYIDSGMAKKHENPYAA